MRMSEITVNENLLKMLGFGKNAATAAVKTGTDDAIRAAQDARLMSIGQRGISATPKAGDRVRLDTASAGKDHRFISFVKRDAGMNLNNYVDGKVVDVVQSGPAGQLLKVKLDLSGEIVNWPAERFVSSLR